MLSHLHVASFLGRTVLTCEVVRCLPPFQIWFRARHYLQDPVLASPSYGPLEYSDVSHVCMTKFETAARAWASPAFASSHSDDTSPSQVLQISQELVGPINILLCECRGSYAGIPQTASRQGMHWPMLGSKRTGLQRTPL